MVYFSHILLVVTMIILVESIHRRGFLPALKWLVTKPGHSAAAVAPILGAIWLITAVLGSFFLAACLVFIPIFGLVVFSSFKHAARNEPLYFADVLLVFKVASVADSSNIAITKVMAASALIGALSLAAAFFLPPLGGPVWPGIIAAALLNMLCLALNINAKSDQTYLVKGFVRGFAANIYDYFKTPRPPSRVTTFPPIQSLPPERPVNIIAVLAESFFDIKRVSKLELSEDPLPFFRSLKGRAVSGTLLVTPFGGGTCAVEAEFLTGIAMRHINAARPFYYSMAKKKVPALPALLKARGYESHAVHTFSKTFYNRAQAFGNMGFDSFTGAEDMPAAPLDGAYIGDAALASSILEIFNKKTSPAFIFGISMENHQPYLPGRYPQTAIKVQNTGLGPRLGAETATYIHGLRHADEMLRQLVDFVDNQNEPTCLLLFGDHLAALGRELDLYRKMGYIGGGALSTADITRIYSPDFVMISNFCREPSRHELVGANFLPYLLLDYAGQETPGLYGELGHAFAHLRCVSRPDVFVGADGTLYEELPENLREVEDRLAAAAFGVIK